VDNRFVHLLAKAGAAVEAAIEHATEIGEGDIITELCDISMQLDNVIRCAVSYQRAAPAAVTGEQS
jgi:hypothetical protein